MTADAFVDWALQQPGRYELVAGTVYAMAPERARHAQCKALTWAALRAAIALAGRRCEAMPDGMSVRIDASTVYEPDALVYCGPNIDPDAVFVPDPVIVVEVTSPSSGAIDSGAKLSGYFAVPSVVHYLVLNAAARQVVHHRRSETGGIETRVLHAGALALDPPGLAVEVADLFPGL